MNDESVVEETPLGARLEATAPLLKVVSGDPTAEELAALVAVVSALGTVEPAPERRTPPAWSAPHRLVRVQHLHGPGGWRSSGLPR